MKSVPIIEYDGYPHYTNTRVEVVTTEAEVRCEIINLPSVPTSPTPLSSPDKSVGDCSKDDQKDLEYIPKHLFLPWWKKWRGRRKRNQTTLKKDYQGKKRFHPTFFFFFFQFCYTLWSISFCYRTSYSKKGSEGPQSESKFIVFFSCLMQLFEFCPLCTEPSTT